MSTWIVTIALNTVVKGWWYLWVKGKGVCGKPVVGNLKELCPNIWLKIDGGHFDRLVFWCTRNVHISIEVCIE